MIREVQTFAIVVSILYNLFVIIMLRQNTVEIKYSLAWIFAGLGMLWFSVCPTVARDIAGLFSISQPINVIFFFAIIFLLVTTFVLTIIITNLKNRIKKLAQMTALNQKILEDAAAAAVAEAKAKGVDMKSVSAAEAAREAAWDEMESRRAGESGDPGDGSAVESGGEGSGGRE